MTQIRAPILIAGQVLAVARALALRLAKKAVIQDLSHAALPSQAVNLLNLPDLLTPPNLPIPEDLQMPPEASLTPLQDPTDLAQGLLKATNRVLQAQSPMHLGAPNRGPQGLEVDLEGLGQAQQVLGLVQEPLKANQLAQNLDLIAQNPDL